MGNFMVQQRFELTNFSRESIIRYSPCLDQGDESVSLIVVGPLSDMAPDSWLRDLTPGEHQDDHHDDDGHRLQQRARHPVEGEQLSEQMSLELDEQQMSPLLPEQMSPVLELVDVTIQLHSLLLVPRSPHVLLLDLLLAVSLLAGVIQGLKMPLEEK